MTRSTKHAAPAAHDAQAVPTILLDAVAVEDVPLQVWHRVFDEIGYPPGTSKKTLATDGILDVVQHAGGVPVGQSTLRERAAGERHR